MTKIFTLLRAGLGMGILFLGLLPAASADSGWLLNIKGAIGPATADYLIRNLDAAKDAGASLVVLQMDTPGGLDVAMRDMIQAINTSPVPVVTYVSPAGARAASAGTYILYASHVAAMAPGTNLGAATPVQIGASLHAETGDGADSKPSEDAPVKTSDAAQENPPAGDSVNKEATPPQNDPPPPADMKQTLKKLLDDLLSDEKEKPATDDTMKNKIVNDAEAYIRSLAQMRGRNAEWAAKAVRESASLPAKEALEKGVIDIVAEDLQALLKQIHGREVKAGGQIIILRTRDLTLKTVEPDWRNRLLAIITDPSVAYIFMLLGVYGLFFEFTNPGAILPGVLGGISLLLALFAFQVLPVNYAGLALILLGLAFMISEAFIPSFGVLGIGGVTAFIFGSIMLMDTDIPGYGISEPLIVTVAVFSGVFFLWVINTLLKIRHKPVVTGHNTMLGTHGECISNRDGHLQVAVRGEIWSATAPMAVNAGDTVQVTGIEGLHLTVERGS